MFHVPHHRLLDGEPQVLDRQEHMLSSALALFSDTYALATAYVPGILDDAAGIVYLPKLPEANARSQRSVDKRRLAEARQACGVPDGRELQVRHFGLDWQTGAVAWGSGA